MTEWRSKARRIAAVLLTGGVALGFGLGPAKAAHKHPAPALGWNSYTGYSIAVTE